MTRQQKVGLKRIGRGGKTEQWLIRSNFSNLHLEGKGKGKGREEGIVRCFFTCAAFQLEAMVIGRGRPEGARWSGFGRGGERLSLTLSFFRRTSLMLCYRFCFHIHSHIPLLSFRPSSRSGDVPLERQHPSFLFATPLFSFAHFTSRLESSPSSFVLFCFV